MRRFVLRLALPLVLAVHPLVASAQAPTWTRAIAAPGTAPAYVGDGYIVGRSLAIDRSGNVVVTGSAGNAGEADILTAKLAAANGAPSWQKTFGGAAGGEDHGMSVAVDASGNAIVAGLSANAAGNADAIVLKYDAASGALVWQKTLAGGGAYVVAADGSGNAVVGAETTNASGNIDIRIVKLAAADGSVMWERIYDGGSDDYVADLALDASGNVFVAGTSVNAAGNNDFTVLRLAGASGAVTWRKTVDSGGDDDAFGIALDRVGNAVVTGFSVGTNADYRTVKLAAADGSIAWQKTYDGGSDDYAQAVAIDSAGNALVTGQSRNAAGNADFVTIAYGAGDGAVLWRKTFDGGADDYAYAIAIGADDAVIVAGSTTASAGNVDWKAIGYAAADGATLFERTYASSGGGNDIATQAAAATGGFAIAGSAIESGLPAGVRVELLAAGAAAASLIAPAPGGTLAGASATFQWTDAGASLYQLWIGTSPGTYDVGYYPARGTTATSTTVSGLPTDGRKLYVRLHSNIGGRYVYRDYTYTASGSGGTATVPGGAASIITPASGATLGGASQTFQWNNAGASLYQLWLGNSPGTYDIGYYPANGTTSTSTTAIGIPVDGRKVYARLYSNIGGSYAYRDSTYTAAGTGGTPAGPPSAATITSPAPGSALPGASATFQWNDSGASLYQLWVGTSPGAFDIGYFPAAGTTAQTVTATGLPTDGRKLYVRLHSAVNGSWQYRDFAYTAAGSGAGTASAAGPASMLTPAIGTTLPGTTVTFTWTDANASLYQLWIGTTPGAFDVGYYPALGTTATSTTVSGIPRGGRTLYVRLYSAIGGSWQFRDYTYRAPS